MDKVILIMKHKQGTNGGMYLRITRLDIKWMVYTFSEVYRDIHINGFLFEGVIGLPNADIMFILEG